MDINKYQRAYSVINPFCIFILIINLYGCSETSDPKAAFEQGEYLVAYQLWIPLARNNDKEAQNYLGIHHYLGLGIDRDYSKAKQWFEKAAVNGYPDAQYNLGQMYENGQGVEQDFLTAYMWFYAANEQGNTNARKHMKSMSEEHKLFPNQVEYAMEKAKPYILSGQD